MAGPISSGGSQYASSSSSLMPSRLSTWAGSIATPVSAATPANEPRMASRESISVMSKSKPTGAGAMVLPRLRLADGQHAGAGGQQPRNQQDSRERQQHRDRRGPAAGLRAQQAHADRARGRQ